MMRSWKFGSLGVVFAGAALMSGCVGGPCGSYQQGAMMSRGACAPCSVPESCGPCQQTTTCDPYQGNPCQGNTFSQGYGYSGNGQPLRSGVSCVEGGVNAVGNLVAGVVTFPFLLVGNVSQSLVNGVGYYGGGCAGGGCSREVYYGDYGYQQQDSCNPCAGQTGMQNRTVYSGGRSDCGCSGNSDGSVQPPMGDDVVMESVSTVQRPTSRVVVASAYQSNLAPSQRVSQASFATPTLRALPVR